MLLYQMILRHNLFLHSEPTHLTEYAEYQKYKDNTDLVDVYLSDGGNSISESCFSGCTELVKVVGSDEIIHIDKFSFHNTPKLETIIFPGVNDVYYYHSSWTDTSFDSLPALKVFKLPKVINLNFNPFSDSPNLEEVDLSSLQSINDAMFFKDKKKLNKVTLLSINYYPHEAFSGCSNLQEFHSGPIGYLSERMFQGCSKLSSFDFSNVLNIGQSAFEGCISLTTIDLSNVNSIGVEAFKDCTQLTDIGKLSKIQSISENAFVNTKLPSTFTITKTTNGLGAIDPYAFKNMNFVRVYIEDNLEIRENAFFGNQLEEVLVGENCVIKPNAFANIATLKNVILKNCVVEKKAFYLCNSIEALHIDGRDLDLQMGCFDYIQTCIYYHGTVDLFMDSTILVINRIFKSVFVNESYEYDTFCLLPVQKGLNHQCPATRISNAKFLNRDNKNNVVCNEQTCDSYGVNTKYAYLLSFVISYN